MCIYVIYTYDHCRSNLHILIWSLPQLSACPYMGHFSQTAFKHISVAARTANRVVAVVHGESENSEDPKFKTELGSGSQSITAGMHVLYHLIWMASSPFITLYGWPPPPLSHYMDGLLPLYHLIWMPLYHLIWMASSPFITLYGWPPPLYHLIWMASSPFITLYGWPPPPLSPYMDGLLPLYHLIWMASSPFITLYGWPPPLYHIIWMASSPFITLYGWPPHLIWMASSPFITLYGWPPPPLSPYMDGLLPLYHLIWMASSPFITLYGWPPHLIWMASSPLLAIGPMVTSAKVCIQQPGSATAHHDFCVKAENVRSNLQSIGQGREGVGREGVGRDGVRRGRSA